VIPKGHHQPMADPFVRYTGARHREDSAIDVFVADLAVLLEFEEFFECHEGRVCGCICRAWLRDPVSLRSRAVELLEPASDSEPIADSKSLQYPLDLFYRLHCMNLGLSVDDKQTG
jgi:hypothetical protein